MFGHVVCITMNNRPERLENIEDQKTRLGMDIEMFVAERSPHGGVYGCAESHKLVHESHLDSTKPILVIEDDCVFENDVDRISECLKEVARFMRETDDQDWDIMFLGHAPTPRVLTKTIRAVPGYKFIRTVRETVCTHAYIVSPAARAKFIERVQESMDSVTPLDYFRDHIYNMFCVYPMLAIQMPVSPSDISPFYEKLRNALSTFGDPFRLAEQASALSANIVVTYVGIAALLFIIARIFARRRWARKARESKESKESKEE